MSDRGGHIGVFDSGIGGLSVLKALRAEMPTERFVYIADSGHAPYGERDDAHVVTRTRALAQHLVGQGAKALVIACNTATAAAIHLLRAEHPDLPIVGVEPALKPAAALSQTRRIGVMATRSTLASARFKALHESLDSQVAFVLQPCDGLASAIERSLHAADNTENATKIIAMCAEYTSTMGIFGAKTGDIDTLVLGCTHYPFASEQLRGLLGPLVQFLDTGVPVARQTRVRLANAARASDRCTPSIAPAALFTSPLPGDIRLYTTGQPAVLQAASRQWLQLDTTVDTLHF